MWAAITATAGVISWQAAALTLASLVVSGVLRLLTEWQRRKIFMALMVGAPEGTVLIQHDSPGEQFMGASAGSAVSLQPPARS